METQPVLNGAGCESHSVHGLLPVSQSGGPNQGQSRDLTEGVSGDDGRVLGRQADAKLVLSEDSEDVLLEPDQAHGLVARLLDGGGEAVPDLAVGRSPLHQVVGHPGATVVARRIPGQQAGLVGDLRDVECGGRAGLVCGTDR